MPEKSESIPAEKWICVGFVVKMNETMDDSDGEQAFWIDKKKIQHLGKGFPKDRSRRWICQGKSGGNRLRWIPMADLLQSKINFFWLNYDRTHGAEDNIKTDTVRRCGNFH